MRAARRTLRRPQLTRCLLEEALAIEEEDRRMCRAIGAVGAEPDRATGRAC